MNSQAHSFVRRGLELLAALTLVFVVGLGGQAARAADPQWPTKPITLIVPYSAGGATDTLARTFAEKLQASLGQSVVVENKVGGNTIVASKYVMGSASDGHTLYVVSSPFNQMPLVSPKEFAYNPLEDFTLISQLAVGPLVLVANTKFPGSTIKEVVERAKAEPGKISIATTGQGSTDHLAAELLAYRTGARFNFIPYKGGSQGIQDVASGVVDLRIAQIASAKPYIDSGRVKVIAVFGERTSVVPGVPAVSDTYPGVSVESLSGLVGPKGMPVAIVERLNREANSVMTSADVQAKLGGLGMQAKAGSAADWKRLIQTDTNTWRALIQQAGIKVD